MTYNVPMKVSLQVIRTHSGADVFFETLYRELSKLPDYEVDIVWHPGWKRFVPRLLSRDSSKKCDVCISNIEYGWVFKSMCHSLILTAHQCVFDKNYRRYTSPLQKLFHYGVLKPNTKKSIRRADRIVSCGDGVKRILLETFGEHDNVVIHNGIDCETFAPPDHPRKPTKPYRILYVGNLLRRKGVDLLPYIATVLGNDYRIAFTSGLRKTRVPDFLTHESLSCIGKLSQKELAEEYRKTDVLLLPTRHEGFGYVIGEAMASGVPCVVSNANATSELVEDGKTGFVTEVDDIRSLADSIVKICTDDALHAKMSKAGRERIVERFSLQRHVSRFDALIRSCAS